MTEIEKAVVELKEMRRQSQVIHDNPTIFYNSKSMPDGIQTLRRHITALDVALAVLREKQEREQNAPLALEELRCIAMDGGVAWCADTDGVHPGLLCFVECVLDNGKEAHIWLLDEEGHAGRYNVRCMLDCGAKFYRRPPEQ